MVFSRRSVEARGYAADLTLRLVHDIRGKMSAEHYLDSIQPSTTRRTYAKFVLPTYVRIDPLKIQR